jgi:DNA-binding transcriptional regulator WhiA
MEKEQYKFCTSCEENKRFEDFYKRWDTGKPRTKCKTCNLVENKDKRKSRRNGKRSGAWYFINQEIIKDDSLETWYYAGLLAADGSVNKGRNRVSLTLHTNDIETVEGFKNHFDYSGPTLISKNKKYVTCAISGVPIIIQELEEKFNIVQNKTSILEPPKNIPSVDHALSYIIGYIDGDGCIFKTEYGHSLTIVGTYKILEFIKKVFSCYGGELPNIRNIKNTNEVCVLVIGGNFKTGKYIYLSKKLLSLNLPRMKRKWDKLVFDN